MISGFLSVAARLGMVGAAFGVLLGLFQSAHPAFDSFSHFRLHLIAVLSVCCLVEVVFGRGWMRLVGLVGIVVAALIFQSVLRKGPPPDSAEGDLRLVQFNLNYGSRSIGRVATALEDFNADVVTLQEVTPAHESILRALQSYPHQTHCFFRQRVGGVSILSKHPLSNVSCAAGEGLVTALVDAPGGPVTVASVHTYWPWPFSQHAQIDGWVPKLDAIRGPLIVAGDFNAAPWSHAVAKVAKASRAKVVPGLRMTIHVKGVPIPIDHVLLSREYCGLAARIGAWLGSDHLPLIVEIGRVDPTLSTGCNRP